MKNLIFIGCFFSILSAQAETQSLLKLNEFIISNTWILISTLLVFIMHLGFACLETGLTRSKNTVNILFKNISIVAIGILSYALCGFNLMYPGEFNGVFGFGGLGINNPVGNAGLLGYADGKYSYFTDFIFQAMFAATAATIVSGAVAERIKLSSFLTFSLAYVAFIYPIAGSWDWGGGWLDQRGFYDFAGSTLVHSVGGWAALVGTLILGPRIGKYGKSNSIKPIFGHNMPLASIGVFLLWFGWYGFNGGSVLSADPSKVSLVFVTTTLAASAGVVGAMITSWVLSRKPDLSMTLNGSLAGLVGITAGADLMTPLESVLIGLISGTIVVLSVLRLDKLKIDDPVGAISVHLICGVWGTIAVGVFSAEHSVLTQVFGVISYGLFCLICSFIIFIIIQSLIGLRVSEQDELIGLDMSEHDSESYAGFQIFTIE